ncbi:MULTISPECIES: phenylalanine--tRNA ligase subunit beta [Metallosphaera]|uniref:Phenylalanine--tRNA ligase beta subunit n=3 Tax=Metallosphaera TaxID=41980 RepID=SYFB_METS5|nr:MULTISPECIES: phenylalanine--tRNA ligase subunit beta [Metallosphaera]A4YIL0.1 RecName: Full=Phenylalanine--tRNA ligase beta subunit; AltName: Full=Phenylalanyl-tRNA synthetase beta subunit; Short=PheRS [Metallosphaera sedula DSM 5348]ABP96262.1 phenylalanyl-tRNA synthetase beta subunit [Metallosphaera sedula DSM 5348]AIM28245.1 phenylalanyl-tRNA synthetase beta subunit [Metallosphaera sedula]AKV75052.1 phenylalanyl-tRNA synthetase subunit beta [Metallosphaera sedula]AKV77291.1 phenylalanyl
MPTINLNKWILQDMTGLNEQELVDYLFKLKSEVSPVSQDEYSIEVNADRLDMLSLGGIVRALKGITGKELGEPSYPVKDTDYVLEVEKVASRPYALACVIYNVKLSPDFYLKELIQFQEKLHDTIGRRRKKVAIGIHDLEKVEGKIIRYAPVSLSTTFIPLNQEREMSVRDVLQETPQGKQYGNISVWDSNSPAIMDERGILSVPPVINSDRTKITGNTKSLLIDVTGTNFESVMETMDLLATALAELGGIIGRVKVRGMSVDRSPVLRHTSVPFSLDDVNKRLGIHVSRDEAINLIRMMRMEVETNKDLAVIVPPYRVDIMNYTDVAEDIAMAYGYDRFTLESGRTASRGSLSEKSEIYRKLRTLLVGAGFQEVYTLVLTKSSYQRGEAVNIANPISVEYDSVRNSLLWNSLVFLSNNQHSRFPVRIFEIGDVVNRDDSKDTKYSNSTRLSMAIMDSRVSYEMLQAPLHEVLLNLLGVAPSYRRFESDIFMKGRSAEVVVKGETIGRLGEANPELLRSFGLLYPVLLAELDLDALRRVM